MQPPLVITDKREILAILQCPKCGGEIKLCNQGNLACQNEDCQTDYPVVNNVPIIIDDDKSLFSTSDLAAAKDTTFNTNNSPIRRLARKIIPQLRLNLVTDQNMADFEEELLKDKADATVLILGGGEIGKGMHDLMSNSRLQFIESDVYWGPRTNMMLDAHSIPFEDGTFDAVIIQAVLEHVVDPYKCVEEIDRVLKQNGFVYSETPFMQQVHMGRFDFTRFTHLGHRRLFRTFEEIKSGPSCGPAMALAWSFKYFLASFATSRKINRVLSLLASLLSFWLVYLDYFLVNKPGSYDAASSYFFFGRKMESRIPDKEILNGYKGMC